MTAEQGRSTSRLIAHQRRRLRLYGTFAVLGCAVATTGCKLGSTSFTPPSFSKPSWWTLNGSSKADATGLASAPPFGTSGDIKKPSESAKPYPVTSTPSGYVINESAAAPAATAATAQAASPQQPVVYGTTPPPSAASPATPAVAAAPPASATSAPPSIAPQVGPYSTLAGETIPPPGQPLPPIAPTQMSPAGGQASAFAAGATAGVAADGAPASSRFGAAGAVPPRPSEAALPSTAFGSPSANAAATPVAEPAAARMADARGGDPAAGFSAGGIPAEQASYGNSRYSSNTASRFGGAAAEVGVPAAAAGAAAYGQPAAGTFPTSMPNTQVPGASPLVTPPTAPGLLQPSSAPVRRPDPVYRPGGTSSYRPSRALLADDSSTPPADATIRAASYDEPVAETIRQ